MFTVLIYEFLRFLSNCFGILFTKTWVLITLDRTSFDINSNRKVFIGSLNFYWLSSKMENLRVPIIKNFFSHGGKSKCNLSHLKEVIIRKLVDISKCNMSHLTDLTRLVELDSHKYHKFQSSKWLSAWLEFANQFGSTYVLFDWS